MSPITGLGIAVSAIDDNPNRAPGNDGSGAAVGGTGLEVARGRLLPGAQRASEADDLRIEQVGKDATIRSAIFVPSVLSVLLWAEWSRCASYKVTSTSSCASTPCQCGLVACR